MEECKNHIIENQNICDWLSLLDDVMGNIQTCHNVVDKWGYKKFEKLKEEIDGVRLRL